MTRPSPSVARALPRLLGDSRTIDVVTAAAADGMAHTVRLQLGEIAAYGTTVEVPIAPPQPGPQVFTRIDHLSPSASRLRVAAAQIVDRPSLFLQQLTAHANGPLAVDADTFRLRVGADVLTSRTLEVDSLSRMGPSAWPAHEQMWQVLHRFAYPLGIAADGSCAFASFELAHDHAVFGLGEDFGPLAKNGTSHRLWMEEAFTNTSPARYKPVPFLWSTAGWGIVVHTTYAVRVDVGSFDHSAVTIVVDDTAELDLVFIAAPTPGDILAEYARLTGSPRVPPRWTFGTWQGRISYGSQAEVMEVAATLRAERLPCDVIHIDTNWFAEDWACDYRFDPERFPDPAQMVADLRDDGFRVCLWQWPNALEGTSTFTEGRSGGWLVGDGHGAPLTQPGFVGPAGVIDYSHPDAAAWIADRLRPLLDLGVAAIKTDFGEGAPAHGTYHAIDGDAAHNAYPLLYNTAFQAALDAHPTGGDTVLWSRSAWAGSQRFPIHWSGDGLARFADLPCVVRSMLSIGMSGIPFYAHDIGGFSGVPSPELLIRWTQLGVLSSHLRFHGFPPREPWAFGEEALNIVRQWLDLRYQLMPYLWRVADESAASGLPMCRAMVLAYPADRTCQRIDDQYLLGNDVLCAPVLTASNSRAVYLPDASWVDWWTGEPMSAGWHQVTVDLQRAPLYRRAGTDLGLAAPGAQHTGQIQR